MIISKKELLDLFEDLYDTEQTIAQMRSGIQGSLKGYSVDNTLSLRGVKEAYKVYKSFRDGKVSATDEDYLTLTAIIEAHFGENEDTADTVSI